MILVTIRVTALAEKRRELLQTVCSMMDQTRQESGCLGHRWYRDLEDENALILVEEWDSQEHLGRYLASERFKVLLGAMHILAEQAEIRFTDVSEKEIVRIVTQ